MQSETELTNTSEHWIWIPVKGWQNFMKRKWWKWEKNVEAVTARYNNADKNFENEEEKQTIKSTAYQSGWALINSLAGKTIIYAKRARVTSNGNINHAHSPKVFVRNKNRVQSQNEMSLNGRNPCHWSDNIFFGRDLWFSCLLMIK